MAKVNWTIYVTGTVLGLLPEVIILVYFGTTLRSLQDVLNGSGTLEPEQVVLMVFGILIAVGLFVFLMKVGREAMNEMDNNATNPLDSSRLIPEPTSIHASIPANAILEDNPRISEEDIEALPSRLPLDLSDAGEEHDLGEIRDV